MPHQDLKMCFLPIHHLKIRTSEELTHIVVEDEADGSMMVIIEEEIEEEVIVSITTITVNLVLLRTRVELVMYQIRPLQVSSSQIEQANQPKNAEVALTSALARDITLVTGVVITKLIMVLVVMLNELLLFRRSTRWTTNSSSFHIAVIRRLSCVRVIFVGNF
ncbi:hypothetical protein TELCIR_19598 [Teladorsagia circumcincta]|uniref:Uncharacterized protein n=1 Tax=Teladorsagia circumcincta TaxID=45464 RepID=A0A2G9TLV5_TELCI|nr:hypothetical protein TELCIR_19598 [Teladorsagia circumcincta]